jgi:hypothetical protein
MGVLLRLAVSAGILGGLMWAADQTKQWPVNQPVRDFNVWANSLLLPEAVVARIHSHELAMYLRNLVAGSLTYHVTAGCWSLYLYVLRRKHFVPDESKVRPPHVRECCRAVLG